jgi:hypothetical protein
MDDNLSFPAKRVLLVEVLEKVPDGNTMKLCEGGE